LKYKSNYYTEPFDLNSYVKNRLLFGVDIDELIEELLTFNKTKDEAKSIITEEIALLTQYPNMLNLFNFFNSLVITIA
jgi:hypothetical protein